MTDGGVVVALSGHESLILRRELGVGLAGLVGCGEEHLSWQGSPALVMVDSVFDTPDWLTLGISPE